jgi:hypothetical protein
MELFQYIQRRPFFAGIDFVFLWMLLQRVEDVGAGDMSLIDPTSPFSIALSAFCMILLSQRRSENCGGGVFIECCLSDPDRCDVFLPYIFHYLSPLYMIVPRTPPLYNPA